MTAKTIFIPAISKNYIDSSIKHFGTSLTFNDATEIALEDQCDVFEVSIKDPSLVIYHYSNEELFS